VKRGRSRRLRRSLERINKGIMSFFAMRIRPRVDPRPRRRRKIRSSFERLRMVRMQRRIRMRRRRTEGVLSCDSKTYKLSHKYCREYLDELYSQFNT
jgi:hypothetical protein